MRRTPPISSGLAIILALTCLATVPTMAAQADFATMTPAGASVMWDTHSTAPQMMLSVAGPEVSIRKTSSSGALSLSLTQANGSAMPDGTYKWEIRESYAGLNDNVSDPANGRDGTPGQARVPVDGRAQSGVFTIKNGFLVDSSLKEQTAQDSAAEKEAQ